MLRLMPLFAWLYLSVPFALGATNNSIVERLLERPTDFTVYGTVAEELYRLQLLAEFNSENYLVVRSVMYNAGQKGKSGEIDLVVFSRHTGQAVLLAEVKGGKNGDKYSKEANEQRERFMSLLREGKIDSLVLAEDPLVEFNPSQFPSDVMFRTVGNLSSRFGAFDDIVDYSYHQMAKMHRYLRKRQQAQAETYQSRSFLHRLHRRFSLKALIARAAGVVIPFPSSCPDSFAQN